MLAKNGKKKLEKVLFKKIGLSEWKIKMKRLASSFLKIKYFNY
jgi:hypothetical protein